MNDYSLISRRDSLREIFNNTVFETADVSRFMIFYMQILEFACEMNVISEAEKLKIADLILKNITEEADSEILPISNCMYVITLWLKSMSNWDAWEKIANVSDRKTATIFLNQSALWFYDKIQELLAEMLKVKEQVDLVNVDNITTTFNTICKSIVSLKTFKTEGTALNLKSMHSEAMFSDYYFLYDMVISTKKNYFDKLQATVYAFVSEIRILSKLDVKSITKFHSDEQIEILKRNERRNIGLSYDELHELEKAYKADIALAIQEQNELDAKIDNLSEEFEKQHPEMTKEELEEAFDEYYDNLPEEFFYQHSDINKINSEYEKKKAEILGKIHEQEKNREQEEQREMLMRGEIELNFSLSYLIKEYALNSFAQKGLMEYPRSPEERGILLSRITEKMAITEFLGNSELDESDIEYLKAVL